MSGLHFPKPGPAPTLEQQVKTAIDQCYMVNDVVTTLRFKLLGEAFPPSPSGGVPADVAAHTELAVLVSDVVTASELALRRIRELDSRVP